MRADRVVRPYNRLPYPRLVLALSFRASDRCHWRGNPFPAPRRGVHLPSAAKVPKNAVQTYGLKIPLRALPAAYLERICHANAVPSKFHLNVALSLLLFPLPLLLRNAGLYSRVKNTFQPAALGRHLPLPLRGKGAI